VFARGPEDRWRLRRRKRIVPKCAEAVEERTARI